ncbi:hypothetical protein DH2020_047279 [Rehmannia glutinosa]|uniref:Protein kinase domain-containing protein n=1 Tax=Rehmannia glutinosa TaxID=99300 RepID=A0ABR0U908_REHGL
MSLFLIFIFFSLFFPVLGDDCKPTSCRKNGPTIQFPFRHKFLRPEYCGYPGFDVYCNENNETVLALPLSVNVVVKKINYVSQQVHLYDPEKCLPKKLPYLNLSASPFHFLETYLYDYTLFNCSASKRNLYNFIPCLGDSGNQFYAIDARDSMGSLSLTSCTKVHEFSSVPWDIFHINDLDLNWCDVRALKPTRFSYSDIRRITLQFSEKLGEGGYGIVYKGKLANEINVAVKVLNNSTGNGEDFVNEVGSKTNSLGWEKLQDIALGIAKGIEYLHQGCDQQILHFDIKPHNILLDHNFNSKICDFGLAKLCSKEQSGVTMAAARVTIGYIAPEVYFPQWIYNHINIGEDIWAQIEKDDDGNIARRLTIVGLWCIQWCPTDRPSMKIVVQMLEGHDDDLAIPPNPFPATNGRRYQTELPLVLESE